MHQHASTMSTPESIIAVAQSMVVISVSGGVSQLLLTYCHTVSPSLISLSLFHSLSHSLSLSFSLSLMVVYTADVLLLQRALIGILRAFTLSTRT
jgi:hypothetical protein